jgi:hypothetical protein
VTSRKPVDIPCDVIAECGRPKRKIVVPERFRRIKMSSSSNIGHEGKSVTAGGPFPCTECDRAPFGHRSGLRRHVIRVHGLNCSWSGRVTPFLNEEERNRVTASVKRSGQHRRPGSSPSPKVKKVDSSSVEPEQLAVMPGQKVVGFVRRLRAEPTLTDASALELNIGDLLSGWTAAGMDTSLLDVPDQQTVVATTQDAWTQAVSQTDAQIQAVVDVKDVGAQAMPEARGTGSQTPRDGTFYLPPGVGITQLLDMMFEHSTASIRNIVDAITAGYQPPLPDDVYQVVELMVRSMVAAQRRMIGILQGHQRRMDEFEGADDAEERCRELNGRLAAYAQCFIIIYYYYFYYYFNCPK